MLGDNHAEYNRNRTRGVPRGGAALLQGIVWCGRCGHKMTVQYKGGNRYLCNFLHRNQGEPVCQHLPAEPIDARVVEAFFAAVTPAELEAWTRAQEVRRQSNEALDRAEAQQVERLRYQAMLAERQFNKVERLTPIIAWSPASWSTAGKWHCASCARPRMRWPGTGRPAPSRKRCRPRTGRAFSPSAHACRRFGRSLA